MDDPTLMAARAAFRDHRRTRWHTIIADLARHPHPAADEVRTALLTARRLTDALRGIDRIPGAIGLV